MLEIMGTPEDVLDQAVLYMRIIFVGMPALMVYNFGAAILRAVGDTKRPLLFLLIAGVINVVLNLVFVIVFHMASRRGCCYRDFPVRVGGHDCGLPDAKRNRLSALP